MEQLPNLHFSVSYTTRLPRGNEREGEDYHFVSPSVFQEMNREANTISSKANDAGISQRIVEIKSELEKIREQVQNIE